MGLFARHVRVNHVTVENQQGMLTGQSRFSQTFRVDFERLVLRAKGFQRYTSTTPATAILKIYDACYFPEGFLVPRYALELYQKELSTYQRLDNLQGTTIPKLYGHGAHIQLDIDVQGPYLVLEDVGFTQIGPSDYYSVKEALGEIHSYGVAHCDIRRENMGKRAATAVVIWDFANATILYNNNNNNQANDLQRLYHMFR